MTIFLKKILFFVILLFPFQRLPTIFFENLDQAKENLAFKIITYLDEMSFLMAIIMVLSFIAIKPKHYSFNFSKISFSKYVGAFVIIAFLSGIVNNVNIFQILFGIYDLIKNIAIVYVFSSLYWTRDEFFSLIKWIKITVIILAIVGILGEFLAFYGIGIGYLTAPEYLNRMGLFRVQSLSGYGSINYLAMYTLLGIFLIYTTTKNKKIKYLSIFLSVILLFLTFSRQAWLGLFVMLLLIDKRTRILGLFLIPILFLLMILISVYGTESYDSDKYYRAFTYIESLRLLKENYFFGAGIGMYGGLASILFESPIYNTWPDFFYDMVHSIGSIDAFWPVIWAETGILGFISFLLIYASLYRFIDKISETFKRYSDITMYKVGVVLKGYTIALIIMCFGTGLNSPMVSFTFFGLVGIYFSLYKQMRRELSNEDKI
jgi:hypothetical protein